MTHLAIISVLLAKLMSAPCVVVIHGTAVVSSSCPSPLTTKPVILPDAKVGLPYSFDLSKSVSGGTPPYNFTIDSTSTFDDLTLSPAGLLKVKPTKTGAFKLSWTVTDSSGVSIYVQ